MLLRESVNVQINVNQPKIPFCLPLLLILSLTCPKRIKKKRITNATPPHTELAFFFKSNSCKNNAILTNFLPSITTFYAKCNIKFDIQSPPRREISTYQSVSILWKGSESIIFVINSFT